MGTATTRWERNNNTRTQKENKSPQAFPSFLQHTHTTCSVPCKTRGEPWLNLASSHSHTHTHTPLLRLFPYLGKLPWEQLADEVPSRVSVCYSTYCSKQTTLNVDFIGHSLPKSRRSGYIHSAYLTQVNTVLNTLLMFAPRDFTWKHDVSETYLLLNFRWQVSQHQQSLKRWHKSLWSHAAIGPWSEAAGATLIGQLVRVIVHLNRIRYINKERWHVFPFWLPSKPGAHWVPSQK